MDPREKVKEELKRLKLEGEIIELDQSTATAPAAAEALEVAVGQIAKSILMITQEEPLLLVTSGDAKISSSKVKKELGKKARMAKPHEVQEITGFEVGGVCPFALEEGLSLYVDENVKRYPRVYVGAGTGNTVAPITYQQLLQLGAKPGDFCELVEEVAD